MASNRTFKNSFELCRVPPLCKYRILVEGSKKLPADWRGVEGQRVPKRRQKISNFKPNASESTSPGFTRLLGIDEST